MTKLAVVPLARARGFGSLPSFLEERAGEAALIRTFQSTQLPLALEAEPDRPIPIRAMAELFERAAHQLGSRTFGLDIGERMTHLGYGNWMRHSLQAPTLREAIVRVCATSWSHQRGFTWSFHRSGPVWLWRATPPLGETVRAQYIDHLIYPMMKFAQHYLGEDWAPAWIEVNYRHDRDAAAVERRLQTPVHFDRQGIALAIRAEDVRRPPLVLPHARPVQVELHDVLEETVPETAPEAVRSVSAVVALRLLDGHADIDGAAQLAGLSLQGLQRRLRREGYSYRQILEATRRTRAVSLLLETRLSISEIALTLGYEEHSNFTRAFTRWMGVSPMKFRGLHRS
ncbi:helix-turn-helix transcriptional regulator [Acuticoccus mangrovi]|uniref:AraC family transcriptional regulator ligand-binding domain-containing protein n=1 Tax=Acuticoccus mangrovi TaxID=2796142 RepID=A0A934IL50_9HYPH|nr:AraC family transcriptional regulator [Acuticoccus mangrovi]MBJ3778518.1 AraC family transcriptional regulator ligand-binding domain-containing protein [Acuticoccus mangrovi]